MQEANVNGVKGLSNVILSHYQQGSNVTKEMVSNRIIAYMYVTRIHSIYPVIVTFHVAI